MSSLNLSGPSVKGKQILPWNYIKQLKLQLTVYTVCTVWKKGETASLAQSKGNKIQHL